MQKTDITFTLNAEAVEAFERAGLYRLDIADWLEELLHDNYQDVIKFFLQEEN